VCVGNKKLIVIGYFRKCIPYTRALVVREIFCIERGDTFNENRLVRLFLEEGERESRSNLENRQDVYV
jgi:hypothetical protein